MRNKANKSFVCKSHGKLVLQKQGARHAYSGCLASYDEKPCAAREGQVSGTCEIARSKTMPSRAKASSVGGLDIRGTVTPEMIGTHRVNRDEKHVRFWPMTRRGSRQNIGHACQAAKQLEKAFQ